MWKRTALALAVGLDDGDNSTMKDKRQEREGQAEPRSCTRLLWVLRLPRQLCGCARESICATRGQGVFITRLPQAQNPSKPRDSLDHSDAASCGPMALFCASRLNELPSQDKVDRRKLSDRYHNSLISFSQSTRTIDSVGGDRERVNFV